MATLDEILASPLIWKSHQPIVKALVDHPEGLTGGQIDALVCDASAHKRICELKTLGVVETRGARENENKRKAALWFLTGNLPAKPCAVLQLPANEKPTAPQPEPAPDRIREPVEIVLQEEVLQRCLPTLRRLYLGLMQSHDPTAADIKQLSNWVADMLPKEEPAPQPPLPAPVAPPKPPATQMQQMDIGPWWDEQFYRG